MTIREEIEKRIGQDPALNRIRRLIESGKATYADTSAYSIRSGKLLGEILSQHILEITPEEREALCAALLHDRYVDINLVVDEVQSAMDAAQELHIAPHHAPENTERSHAIGSSLADPTKPDDVIERRARSAPETATKAVHDDRMESEAKFRSSAGLRCYLNRVAVGGCCPWCSDVAGRYVYGDHPDDIFRRHDNCDCTVTFEDGRKRQDVWSKKTWEVPGKDAGAGELHFVSEEQAAENRAKNKAHVLTNRAQGGIMRVADSGSIYHKITDENIQKVPLLDMFGDNEKNKRYHEANKALLREAAKYEPGIEVSIVYDADMKPIKDYGYVVGEVGHVTIQNPGVPFHVFHNHASGETLSYADMRGFVNNSSLLSITATGNTGSVYSLARTKQSDSFGFGCFLRNKSKAVIFSAEETDFTLEKIVDEETRKSLKLIVDKLQPEQRKELADAILSQTEKCLKGGAKYGFKYTETAP